MRGLAGGRMAINYEEDSNDTFMAGLAGRQIDSGPYINMLSQRI